MIYRICLFVCCAIGFLVNGLNAQIAVYDSQEELKHIPGLKNKTLYVIMVDLDSDEAKEQIEVYKKYWTYSDIEFIEKKDYLKYKKEGNYFMGFTFRKSFTTVEQRGVLDEAKNGSFDARNSQVNNSSFTLFLWKVEKNKKKELVKNELTAIALTVTPEAYFKVEDPFKTDNGIGGYIQNWSPGHLKNYLQKLVSQMELEKPRASIEKSVNETKLKQLKNNVLFIPESVLLIHSRSAEPVPVNVKELFNNYPYQVDKISDEDLSDRILNDKKPFYYFLFHRLGNYKLYTIVESTTGEIIYSKSTSYGYGYMNMKEKELDKMFKKIKKLK